MIDIYCKALDYYLEEKAKGTPQKEIELGLKYHFNLSDDEIISAFQYLKDLGYMSGIYNNEQSITFIGRNFISNEVGGFVQKEINEARRIHDQQLRIDRAETNADRLTLGTWFLVIATLILAIVEIVK
jgi:hypothetical protein